MESTNEAELEQLMNVADATHAPSGGKGQVNSNGYQNESQA